MRAAVPCESMADLDAGAQRRALEWGSAALETAEQTVRACIAREPAARRASELAASGDRKSVV